MSAFHLSHIYDSQLLILAAAAFHGRFTHVLRQACHRHLLLILILASLSLAVLSYPKADCACCVASVD